MDALNERNIQFGKDESEIFQQGQQIRLETGFSFDKWLSLFPYRSHLTPPRGMSRILLSYKEYVKDKIPFRNIVSILEFDSLFPLGDNHEQVIGMHVGEKIRNIREEKRMDQKTLAEKTGFSQTHLSQIELGKKLPSLDGLEKIAGALGCSGADLLRIGPAANMPDTLRDLSEPNARKEDSIVVEIETEQGTTRVVFPVDATEEQISRTLRAVFPERFGAMSIAKPKYVRKVSDAGNILDSKKELENVG